MLLSLTQVLLAFVPPSSEPIRCGVPLPPGALARGLRAQPSGIRLQWSLLQPNPGSDPGAVWVEIAITGHRAGCRVRVVSDGSGGPASPGGSGDVVRRDCVAAEGRRSWIWRTAAGAVLQRESIVRSRTSPGFEEGSPAGGQWTTRIDPGVLEHCVAETFGDDLWRRRHAAATRGGLGVLPASDQGAAIEMRAVLATTWQNMPAAPGPNGRGDYVRIGDDGEPCMTNLEDDTTLGFLRLALVRRDRACLRRAHAAAYHLIDEDLDVASGLPFRHGAGHRSARPEAGHCWVRGLLWTGCVYADRVLIDAALEIARSLARRVVTGRARVEHARDVGTPLQELEAALVFSDEPMLRDACDALGADLLQRWDERLAVFRFPEGETAKGSVYRERAWQMAGCVVPGLRAFTLRTGSSRAREVLARIEDRLLELLRAGRPGIPSSYALGVRSGEVFGVARHSASPITVMLLEGLGERSLRRVLQRRSVRRALENALDPDSDRLATDWSMIARCAWVWR